jgi:quercetin dioxygenase-like cupin family protein
VKLSAGLVLVSSLMMGCATAPPAAPAKPANDHNAHHHEHAVPAASSDMAHGMVALPPALLEGPKREVLVLVDRPELKLATIILRAGTALPKHNAPVPVTIQLLEGSGTAFFGANEERMHASKVLLLEADEAHAIVPDEGTTMVLLLHYLRGAGADAHDTSDHHRDAH